MGGGSPPRVWGTVKDALYALTEERFIPACVGNSVAHNWQACCLSVHPRVCGEQMARGDDLPVLAGSSPRVWGTA